MISSYSTSAKYGLQMCKFGSTDIPLSDAEDFVLVSSKNEKVSDGCETQTH